MPASARDIDTSRAVVREAESTAANKQVRAHGALEAQRLLEANATAPLAASLVVDARLEALRRQQGEKLRQIAAEREATGISADVEIDMS
jgi:regulator of protease activity HflC (stomatin/prohibitin superfamily)